ncbi:MAG: class I SAM-dependent methyltransferase [Methanobacteriota archaeon]|nr:MAG: class I SAM-dependent methyltransferase [Euryarchaeota archaeon]
MTNSEWLEVISAMEEVAPYYDRVNQLITFGLADRWRAEVAARAKPDDVVLEMGSGPGTFARHLDVKQAYCLEPSGQLVELSKGLMRERGFDLIRGVGENVPLPDESVDKVFCSFSFRDFRDRESGAIEMFRVLRTGGEVFIADVAKPPPSPLSRLLQMHVRHVVPMMARMAVHPSVRSRWKNDPYRKFVETYDAFGFTTVYEKLLKEKGFEDISTEFLRMKGATMTRGKKPWKSTS